MIPMVLIIVPQEAIAETMCFYLKIKAVSFSIVDYANELDFRRKMHISLANSSSSETLNIISTLFPIQSFKFNAL